MSTNPFNDYGWPRDDLEHVSLPLAWQDLRRLMCLYFRIFPAIYQDVDEAARGPWTYARLFGIN